MVNVTLSSAGTACTAPLGLRGRTSRAFPFPFQLIYLKTAISLLSCLSVSAFAPDTDANPPFILPSRVPMPRVERGRVICHLSGSRSASSLAVRAVPSPGRGSGWHGQQQQGRRAGPRRQDAGRSWQSCRRCRSSSLICLRISLFTCLKSCSTSSKRRSCNDIIALQSASGRKCGRDSLRLRRGKNCLEFRLGASACVSRAAGAVAAFQRAPYDVAGPLTRHSSAVAMGSAAQVRVHPRPPAAAPARGPGACAMAGQRSRRERDLDAVSRTVLLQLGCPRYPPLSCRGTPAQREGKLPFSTPRLTSPWTKLRSPLKFLSLVSS